MRSPTMLVATAAAAVATCCGTVALAEDAQHLMSEAAEAHQQGLAAAFQYGRPDQKWTPSAVPEHEASGYTGDIPAMFLEVSAAAEVRAADTAQTEEHERLGSAARESALLSENSRSTASMRGRRAASAGGRNLEMMGGMGGGMAGGAMGGSMGAAGGAGATGAMGANPAAAAAPMMQAMQQQQMEDLADLAVDDGRNPAAERIISDPDSIATELSERTKKVPHSWFGKGMFLAPTYQIATGREECNVCQALIENWNELHLDAKYSPGNELAPEYRGLYGKQSLEEKRGEARAVRNAMMGQMNAQAAKMRGMRKPNMMGKGRGRSRSMGGMSGGMGGMSGRSGGMGGMGMAFLDEDSVESGEAGERKLEMMGGMGGGMGAMGGGMGGMGGGMGGMGAMGGAGAMGGMGTGAAGMMPGMMPGMLGAAGVSSGSGLSALLDDNLKGSGAIVSSAEEFEFEYLLAGIKPEYADMAAGFETYLTTCPSFKNNLCHEDLGGSERLRSPCPMYLQCYYCLRINPLYCLDHDDNSHH